MIRSTAKRMLFGLFRGQTVTKIEKRAERPENLTPISLTARLCYMSRGGEI